MNPSPLIRFEEMPWQQVAAGFRAKTIQLRHFRLRLVEISEAFEEEGWCTKGHSGYIIDGRLHIRFPAQTLIFQKGDGIHIGEGEQQKHQAFVQPGEQALLILMD